MISDLGLNDSKSHQVSRTLLSILVDLNNSDSLYSSSFFKSSNPFINSLVAVPSALITTGITVTFMLHSFSFLKRGLFSFSLSFSFTLRSADMSDSTIQQVLCFLLTMTRGFVVIFGQLFDFVYVY